MAPSPEAANAAEWAILAMALRSVFARCTEVADFQELRLSVTADVVPGVALVEYELVDTSGMARAGGVL